jgi:glycosyltransferase involved in cell wall biosynthesis
MSFSGLEGLPLPPVEAALCGNRVVGYHGQGGLEYWDPALFRTVECGDILGFARAVLEEVEGIERLATVGRSSADETQETARELLRRRYSPEREAQLLAQFVQQVVELMGSSSATSQ